MIRRLSKDVRGHLRTGVALTSVAQCVEELVLNAVDAGATCVAVRIDLPNLTLQVVDNGSGITADQLPHVGERYATSKCHSVEDLENLKYFGYRGEALASLCSAASFLDIVTRPQSSTVTYTKCFHKGKPLTVGESATPRPSAGTTVNVRDLFYNLPVRKKSVNEGLEMEKIRYRMAGLALMWPSISFSLRDDITGNVILQTHKCSGVLSTFSSLFGGMRAKTMCEVATENDTFRISGFVGRENYSRKDLQFVFVNRRLVLKSKVHKVINTALSKSTLIKRRTTNSSDKTAAQASSSGKERSPSAEAVSPTKQFERYGVFVINIDCPFSAYDITFDPAKTLVEFHDWQEVTCLIEEMITKFLKEENLLLPSEQQTEAPSENSEDVSQDVPTGSPDIVPETEDPFQGDTEEIDEDFHIQQQQKRYTQGISTYNNLNSLFSRTVRRPLLPAAEDDSMPSEPSCAKKSKLSSENTTDVAKKTVCSRPAQDAGKHDTSHQNRGTKSCSVTVGETEHLPETPVVQTSVVSSEHTLPFSTIVPSTQMSGGHSRAKRANEGEQSNDQDNIRSSVSENRTSVSVSQNVPFTSCEVEYGSVAKSAAYEIKLPEQFGYTSSLSRLRSELGPCTSSAARPKETPTLSGLERFSRTAYGKGKYNDRPKETVRNRVEHCIEFSDSITQTGEIVLPPLKGVLLYRSKSLDSKQACRQETGQHVKDVNQSHKPGSRTVTTFLTQSRSRAHDDFSVAYNSVGSPLYVSCARQVSRQSKVTVQANPVTRCNTLASDNRTRASLLPPTAEPSRDLAMRTDECVHTGRGKSLKRNFQVTSREENSARSEFVSRKRVHTPPLPDTTLSSQLPEVKTTGQRKGLSQAAKLARLVRKEQEPSADPNPYSSDALSSQLCGGCTAPSNQVSRGSYGAELTKQNAGLSSSLNIRGRIAQQTVGVTEDIETHLPVSKNNQCNTQETDFGALQPLLNFGQEDTGSELTAVQMPAGKCNQQSHDSTYGARGSHYSQPSFFQTPHTVFAELHSVCERQREVQIKRESISGRQADVQDDQDTAPKPRSFGTAALFETPNTVFRRIALSEKENAKSADTEDRNRGRDRFDLQQRHCSDLSLREYCCGGAVVTAARNKASEADIYSRKDTTNCWTQINTNSHCKSQEALSERHIVSRDDAMIPSSCSQRESITQGFQVCTSQGFVPSADDFDSMPFEVKSKTKNIMNDASQNDSPLSTQSAGFSPNVCDPLLFEEEEDNPSAVCSLSCHVIPGKNHMTKTANSNIDSETQIEEPGKDLNEHVCNDNNVSVEGLPCNTGTSLQRHGQNVKDIAVNKTDDHVQQKPHQLDAYADPNSTDLQNSAFTHSRQSSKDESRHGACLPETQNDKCGTVIQNFSNHTAEEDTYTSQKQDTADSENREPHSVQTVAPGDSQAGTDSCDITCGQKTPQSPDSKAEHSETQSQNGMVFLLQGHSLPSVTVEDPALKSAGAEEKKLCASSTVFENGDYSNDRSETRTQNCQDTSENIQGSKVSLKVSETSVSSALPSGSSPQTPNQARQKKEIERRYDLSGLRKASQISPRSGYASVTSSLAVVNAAISQSPRKTQEEQNKTRSTMTRPCAQIPDVNPQSTTLPSTQLNGRCQPSAQLSGGHSGTKLITEARTEIPTVQQHMTSVNLPSKRGGESVFNLPACDEENAAAQVSQQSADSFGDSLSDSTLAAVTMPESQTSQKSCGPTHSVSAGEAGGLGSIFTQNAYSMLHSAPSNTHTARDTSSDCLIASDSADEKSSDGHIPEVACPESPAFENKKQRDPEPRWYQSGAIVSSSGSSSVSQKLAASQRRAAGIESQTTAENPDQQSRAQEREQDKKSDNCHVQWIPVTDPKTGGKIYVNSSSGHTLTEAQWEETGLQNVENEASQAGSLKCAVTEKSSSAIHGLSPLSHGALEALLAEHFDGDDEETRTKWRDGHKTFSEDQTGDDVSSGLTGDLLETWDNPVYRKPDQVFHVAEQRQSSRASKVAQCFLHPTAFSKQMLAGGKAIGQVDNKFVACLIQEEKTPASVDGDKTDGGLVVLFDQHAAHERVRLEQLTSTVYEKNASGDPSARIICRSEVSPPRIVTLSEENVRLMQSFREEFDRIGVVFDVDPKRRDTVHVRTMPACMAQREANDRKRGKDPLSYEYLETMLKEHTQLLKTTAGAKRQLPQSVHRLIATHACKGAIKFGDKLSVSTCQELLQALSSCDLPFQCAHGRPSLAPLLSLSQLRLVTQETRRPPNLWKLRNRMQKQSGQN